MSLLDHNKGDAGPVVPLDLDASFPDCGQLMLQYVQKLALRHAVTVQYDTVWLVATGTLVKHDQQFSDHGTQLLNDLLPVLLHSHSGCIAAGVSVHRAHHCSDRWLLVVSGWRVRDIRTEEDHRFVKYLNRPWLSGLWLNTLIINILNG